MVLLVNNNYNVFLGQRDCESRRGNIFVKWARWPYDQSLTSCFIQKKKKRERKRKKKGLMSWMKREGLNYYAVSSIFELQILKC